MKLIISTLLFFILSFVAFGQEQKPTDQAQEQSPKLENQPLEEETTEKSILNFSHGTVGFELGFVSGKIGNGKKWNHNAVGWMFSTHYSQPTKFDLFWGTGFHYYIMSSGDKDRYKTQILTDTSMFGLYGLVGYDLDFGEPQAWVFQPEARLGIWNFADFKGEAGKEKVSRSEKVFPLILVLPIEYLGETYHWGFHYQYIYAPIKFGAVEAKFESGLIFSFAFEF